MAYSIEYKDSLERTNLTLTANIFKDGVSTHTGYTVNHVSGGYYRRVLPDQTAGEYFVEIKQSTTLIASGTIYIPVTVANQIEVISGVVGSSPAASAFVCSTLSTVDDFYNGSVVTFTSGNLTGIARKISNYIGASKTLQFAFAFPESPAQNDTFKILGRIE